MNKLLVSLILVFYLTLSSGVDVETSTALKLEDIFLPTKLNPVQTQSTPTDKSKNATIDQHEHPVPPQLIIQPAYNALKPAPLKSEAEEMAPYDRDFKPIAPQPKSKLTSALYNYNNYDSLKSRYIPKDGPSWDPINPNITEARLKEVRKEFMYWYFDLGGPENEGDWQRDIHSSTPQIHKNFNFQLPFFGFRFNYTRLSLNGYLEFSDPPEHYTYPLTFPNKEWPKKRDPSFIGIFFSKCRVGKMRPEEVDQRATGVYFRLERDLQGRTDAFGNEVRERVKWDIREGVVGSDSFDPKHVAIITWKNVSFAGGIDNSLYKTNTFQMVLATDEVYAYAIFNYKMLTWTSHTEAGGDTTNGEGGVPAYVGFNAGNGTRSLEYAPYSQNSVIRDLTNRGWANNFPGRHIFRIDENIMLGTCNKDIAGTNLPLVFAPESGNMLGGTVVNISGPCFLPGMRVRCRFDNTDVIGTIVDRNRAICVQPFLMAEGYVRFEISVDNQDFKWKGKFFVETPATATERIHFDNDYVHDRAPPEIRISWEKLNLTTNTAATLRLSLWGYKETTIRPELMYIDTLEDGIVNTGSYTISPASYNLRENGKELRNLRFGFLHINLTNPNTYSGLTITPVLWSKPIPLGWYFGEQWRRQYGNKWPDKICDTWLMNDRYLKNFAADVSICPCTLEHALADKGRYLPDFNCDKDRNPQCIYNDKAQHCVLSGAPGNEGAEQQCCYDKNGYLMLTYDQQWGSKPRRSHNLGFLPWNEANKVPTLSQWFHDISPFYFCCKWQEEQAVGCETYRFERRATQDCVAYQAPAIASVFGDPHFITFDNVEYTFNGKGEFVLLQSNSEKHKLNIQARFEQLPDNIYGEVMATQLTAVAAQDNSSAVIEVKLRPKEAQWRYRLDVLANGKRIYFDRSSLKIQHFPGVTVYTPTYILNQSEVIIMFQSGAGVEVVENEGFVSTRVYLPWSYINQTSGLLGNWSFDINDDFVLPDGNLAGVNAESNNFERLHKDFAIHWMLDEQEEGNKIGSLFTHEHGRLGSYYNNRSFVPEYRTNLDDIVPANRSQDVQRAKELCGISYQCRYDYIMSLKRDMAHFTLNYYNTHQEIKKILDRRVTTCGILETPRFGRKSTFLFVPDSKVTFECNEGFTLVGDKRRVCTDDGHWDYPEHGYTECLRQQEYSSRQAGITWGIVLGILIPIILIVVFILYKLYFKGMRRSGTSFKDAAATSRRSQPVLRGHQYRTSDMTDQDSHRITQ